MRLNWLLLKSSTGAKAESSIMFSLTKRTKTLYHISLLITHTFWTVRQALTPIGNAQKFVSYTLKLSHSPVT